MTILSAIMNFFHFRKQRMELMLEKQAKYVCFKGGGGASIFQTSLSRVGRNV